MPGGARLRAPARPHPLRPQAGEHPAAEPAVARHQDHRLRLRLLRAAAAHLLLHPVALLPLARGAARLPVLDVDRHVVARLHPRGDAHGGAALLGAGRGGPGEQDLRAARPAARPHGAVRHQGPKVLSRREGRLVCAARRGALHPSPLARRRARRRDRRAGGAAHGRARPLGERLPSAQGPHHDDAGLRPEAPHHPLPGHLPLLLRDDRPRGSDGGPGQQRRLGQGRGQPSGLSPRSSGGGVPRTRKTHMSMSLLSLSLPGCGSGIYSGVAGRVACHPVFALFGRAHSLLSRRPGFPCVVLMYTLAIRRVQRERESVE
mmetsp:Transcript_18901/g.57352  ORF Transcript_18901/g.57352 Transcript_18901/m.57352 type:complete len:318 (+) Transcript_18901:664-1617(+)